MNRFPGFLTLVAALAPCLASTPARASSDRLEVTSDRVTITMASHGAWSPEMARRWAKWVGRISALVPEGKVLQVDHGAIAICNAGTTDCVAAPATWDDGSLSTLFELTADLFATPAATITSGRRSDGHPLTVQVAATSDRGAAERLAERLNRGELELHGFLQVGGLPAFNDYAHVVVSPTATYPTYHVVVGAFLDRAQAEEALGLLDSDLGFGGYIRPLNLASPHEEGC